MDVLQVMFFGSRCWEEIWSPRGLWRDQHLWKEGGGNRTGPRDKSNCKAGLTKPQLTWQGAVESELPTRAVRPLPFSTTSSLLACTGFRLPKKHDLRSIAEANLDAADSWRLTTLPAAGQQVFPWMGNWVAHLCVSHRVPEPGLSEGNK